MSTPALPSRNHGSSDCVYCQQLTKDAVDGHNIDMTSLYKRLVSAEWSIENDDDWELLANILQNVGFIQRTGTLTKTLNSALPVLPSRIIIVTLNALTSALKKWPVFRKQSGNISYDDRMVILLQFVANHSKDPINRRVLQHHDALLLVFETLAALRESGLDLISDGTTKHCTDNLLVTDVRTLDPETALNSGKAHGGSDSKRARISVYDSQSAASVLFRHTLQLCIRLFDPDANFAKYLQSASAIESISEFNLVDAQDTAEDVLAELLCVWRRLKVIPPRAQFSQAAVSLCHATGSILVSGRIDSQQVQQLGVVDAIAESIRCLNIDEAYLAWRIAALLETQYADLSAWSSEAVTTQIDSIWSMTAVCQPECLRNYKPSLPIQPTTSASTLLDIDKTSLGVIFQAPQKPITEHVLDFLRHGDGLCGRQSGSQIESRDLASYVSGAEDSLLPDTRLRRLLDTLCAQIIQSPDGSILSRPIKASLLTLNKQLLSVTYVLQTDSTSKHGSSTIDASSISVDDSEENEDRVRRAQLFVFEYVRFLWNVWSLALSPAVYSAIFRTMGPEVWNRLLTTSTTFSTTPAIGTASTKDGFGVDAQRVATLQQRLFVLCGWLLTRSEPQSTATHSPCSVLDPHTCKLLFSQMANAMSTLSLTLHISAHDSSNACMAAFFAAQGLAIVSWDNVSHFRLLLHETQSVVFLIESLYRLGNSIDGQEALRLSASTELVTQSIGNLSVVSLPEESVWNIAENKPATSQPQWARCLADMTMYLLHMSLADSVSAQSTSTETSLVSVHGTEDANSGPLSIVWQICNSSIEGSTEHGSDEVVSCQSALSSLAKSGDLLIAQFSKLLSISVMRWLILTALGSSVVVADTSYADTADKVRMSNAQDWSRTVVSWLVPGDLGSKAAIKQHFELLAHLRESLAKAVLALGLPGSYKAVRAFLMQGNNTMGDLLGLVQLAATLDPVQIAQSASLFSSFTEIHNSPLAAAAGAKTTTTDGDGSLNFDSYLGQLVGEALMLVAFLIHGSSIHTRSFAQISGYSTVHTCIVRIAQHILVSREPIVRGILSLLSGSMDPANCRALGMLKIDQNWIPTLTAVLPRLSLAERIPALRFIASWCEASSRAQWYWSQSTLVRQCVERLHLLLSELSSSSPKRQSRHSLAISYTKCLGRMLVAITKMAISAPDLKLLIRTLVSGPGVLSEASALIGTDECSEYTAIVRQMLSLVLLRCARSTEGGNYFSFDGRLALIRSSHFYRVPERGLTFTAWVYPDKILARNDHQHLLAKQSFTALASLAGSGATSRQRSANALSMLLHGDGDLRPTVGTILYLEAAAHNGFAVSHDYATQGIDIQVTANGTCHSVHCGDGTMSPGRWHSVAICYTPPKRGWSPFGSSNMYVYIDGVLVHKCSIPFIDHTNYRASSIGGAPGSDSSTFSGRMAGIRMFDGPLRINEIEILHHLGPAHSSQLRKSQIYDPSISEAALHQVPGKAATASLSDSLGDDISGLFRSGDLSSRMIVCLDASYTDRNSCLDLSPIGICQAIVRENISDNNGAALGAASGAIPLGIVNQEQGTSENSKSKARLKEASQPWSILGDVLPVTATTIHRAIFALGGLEVSLVLLQNLGWIGPASPPTKEGPLGSEESAFDQRTLDFAPLPSYFYWLRDLVRGNPWHLPRIFSFNLVGLVARTLQLQLREPGAHLTMAALRAIQAFQVALDEQGGLLPSSYAGTSQLWSQVQRELVLNFKIWRRADVATQSLYLKEVHRILCVGRRGDRAKKRCNASSGVCGPGAGSSSGVTTTSNSSNVEPSLGEATNRPISPLSTAGDGVSISTDSIVANSDDGFGLADMAEDNLGGDVPGFPVLTRGEVRQLRRTLLHTLELFLSVSDDHGAMGGTNVFIPEPTKTDIANLTGHLLYACNRDTEHTREILQLLFRCLADGSPAAASLASKLLSFHGMDVLCHIIECDDDSMAAEAINIVVLLLTMSVASREQETAASRITNSLRGRAPIVVEAEDVARVLALVRTKRALTPALYRSLLSLALRNHEALLASANTALPSKAAVASAPASRRARHVRNLSVTQGMADSTMLAEDASAEAHTSFVGPLPARLIQIGDAWSAILDLSCAPGTDPALRVVVLTDLQMLLTEEPENYVHIHASHISLFNHLVLAVVLSGYIPDAGIEYPQDTEAQSRDVEQLADAFNKASNHLDLIPHTTLCHSLQGLAVGHSKTRKAWVQRYVNQLRNSSEADGSSDTGDALDEESLVARARSELMKHTVEWSKAAIELMQTAAWSLFHTRVNYAEQLHHSIILLWALTPTGSISLAISTVSRVLAQMQSQLPAVVDAIESAPATDWTLVQNLVSFSSSVLDMLLNYHQFQEYIAYHHEQLKALSAGASMSTLPVSRSERDKVYRSQNSPWDDTPDLARGLAEFMLQVGEHEASLRMPLCGETLRLILSGVRSMDMRRVEESLSFLIRLLCRHPSLGMKMRASDMSSAQNSHICQGVCGISQLTFATLGYIHEAYMFTDEQNELDSEPTLSSKSEQSAVRDRIGELYLLVVQCYQAYLGKSCAGIFGSAHVADSSGRDNECPSNWQEFVDLLKSPEWQELYRSKFMPAMRNVEEEEMRQANSSLDRFASVMRNLLQQSHRSEMVKVRAAKSAQTSIASRTLPIEADETTFAKADNIRKASYGPWPRLWRHRLRELSAPRGPWRSGSDSPLVSLPGRQRWMLDATENSSRMRRRLTKNGHFEDHRQAASRRDHTGQKGAKKVQSQPLPEKASSFDDDEGVPHLSLSVSGGGTGAPSLDGDEEWSLVTSEDLGVVATSAAAEPGRPHFSVGGERIVMLASVCGRIELTQSLLRFTVERDKSGEACLRGSEDAGGSGAKHAIKQLPRVIHAEINSDLCWSLSDIQQVHLRRFMLRSSAVEIFFRDRTSAFFNVPNKKGLMQLIWKLTSLPAVNGGLTLSDIRSPPALLYRLKLTERWQHGELSNFDYLMALNTVAGRSYNDLSQYPVFPWVISDYKSKWLDLNNPMIYRDLSRPIGALNEKRLRHFIERYESFEDPSGRIKKFHYGTHYSSAASVAYYLIRMEPFLSVHIALQSGKLDHADRQFHSIGDAWSSCMSGPGDVKELVPEFFYMPEFLTNQGGVDLGKKQDGTRLGDVRLPPWASTAEEFVSINRQALESDYVSANLHKWIDLIFGYKQRGIEAEKAHNVFYYLTYEGAVNLDTIQDPVERSSVESQINYFGQTPTQLFNSPHPPRHGSLPQPLYSPLVSSSGHVQHFILQVSGCDIVFVGSSSRLTRSQSPGSLLAARSIPWSHLDASLPPASPLMTSVISSDLGAGGMFALGSSKNQQSKETITLVDSAGRASVYQLTLFTSSDYKFQLTVDPLVEGTCVLTAACPPSDTQRRAQANRRPVSYAVIPNVPELLVSCAHADSTVRCSRIIGERDSLSADALSKTPPPGSVVGVASHSTSMSNAYAGSVVGAMSSNLYSAQLLSSRASSSNQASRSPASSLPVRPFAGLFGGVSHSGPASSSNKREQALSGSSANAADSESIEGADPPSVFIPMAARLLDSINATSCLYMPDQLTCVSVGETGTCAVAGSSQGMVFVLGADFGSGCYFGSGVDASGLGNGPIAAAAAPLLFAAGLADPMNTEVGYTSMSAYSSKGSSGIGIGGGSSSIWPGTNGSGGTVAGGCGNSYGGGANGESTGAGKWTLQHMLHGHDGAVLDTAISSDHDVIASASVDGTVILWAARAGQYLRTLMPASPQNGHLDDYLPAIARGQRWYSRAEQVLVSADGLVICYTVSGSDDAIANRDKKDPLRALNRSFAAIAEQSDGLISSASNGGSDSQARSNEASQGSSDTADFAGECEVAALHVYNINGRHLRTRKLVHRLNDMALTKDGRYGACVSADSRVAVFDCRTLGVVRQFELPACGLSVVWSGASEQQLVVGCEGGRLVVISADLSYIH
ncbi:hypothetical protein GGI07_000774 [Coemansia sp. Benny D115]|nr:hypothetical protein GGI07_000774 [Coemansia sp. Benny D115]